LADGSGGGVSGLLGVEFRLGDIERLDEVVELQDGGVAALRLLGPEEADELCEALVKPGLAGLNPGVGEGVSERGGVGGGGERGDGSDEERAILEGFAGVVEDGESGEGMLAEPELEQGRDLLGGGGEGGENPVIGGLDGEDGKRLRWWEVRRRWWWAWRRSWRWPGGAAR